MNPEAVLHPGLQAMGLDLPEEAEKKMLAFVALLAKWNRTYNLTAIRDETEMVRQHLLDSLSVLPYLGGVGRLADVGSGAGLPGLVLAMARPALHVESIESNQKKAAFQRQAKIELDLPFASIHCVRVEDYVPEPSPDAVISRAFSSLAGFIAAAGHLVSASGRLLAMKGRRPGAELASLPAGWGLELEQRLSVPCLDAERFLVVLKRV